MSRALVICFLSCIVLAMFLISVAHAENALPEQISKIKNTHNTIRGIAEIQSATAEKAEEKLPVIITLKKADLAAESESLSFEDNVKSLNLKTNTIIERSFAAEISAAELASLENSDLIERIEYNYKIKAMLNDTKKQMNATRVHAAQLNGLNLTGAGQTVCVLDSGVNYTHADLGGCLGSGCKIIIGFDFVNDDADPYDDNGHGTHVAGIVAASGSATGIAPGSNIAAVKVLNSAGTGSTANAIAGVKWCIGNASAYNISVITMSFGTDNLYTNFCDSDFATFAEAINNATAVNITVLAATGNDGNTTAIASPACITNTTAVGAVTKGDSATYNRNNITDLLAPGVAINSTAWAGNYSVESGTSMSAPHAAAAFALFYQFYKSKFGASTNSTAAEKLFKDNGVNISDASSGLNFSRINILSVLATFDSKYPNMTVAPGNNSGITRGAPINVTIADDTAIFTATYSLNNRTNTSLSQNSSNNLYQINTTGWPAGQANVTIYASDIFDNFNSTAFVFNLSNTQPSASNVTIQPASPVANTTMNCNYTFSDTDGDINNNTMISWYMNGTRNSTFENLTLINASYAVKNQVWMCSVLPNDGLDFGANVNSSNTTIQNSAPLATVIYPNTSTKLSNSIVINASVTDIDGQGDILIVYFWYTNGTNYTLIGNSTAAVGSVYNITFNTSAIADGRNYNIFVNATDGTGVINDTSDTAFIINNKNENPTVNLTAPVGGETWSGDKSITWNATDPEDDTLTITIYYSNNSGSTWAQLASGEANDGRYDWNTKGVNNGDTYRLRVNATDGELVGAASSASDFKISNGGSSSSSSSSSSSGTSSGSSASESSGGGGLNDNTAKSFFLKVAAGDTIAVTTSKAGFAVTEFSVTAGGSAENVKLIIEKLDANPESPNPPGVTYAFSALSAENLESSKISNAKIKFKVPQSWIKLNLINKNSIRLYRHTTSWQELPTDLISQTQEYATFEASSPGLSYFAVAGKKKSGAEIAAESAIVNETANVTAASASPLTGFAGLKMPDFGAIKNIGPKIKSALMVKKLGLPAYAFVIAALAILFAASFARRYKSKLSSSLTRRIEDQKKAYYQKYAKEVEAAKPKRRLFRWPKLNPVSFGRQAPQAQKETKRNWQGFRRKIFNWLFTEPAGRKKEQNKNT
ncbi:MAG: S8 family serine peptidase [DPANN group archaeon]|nr:S8 family serine peptidase [DPANN group archaeon]